MMWSIVALCAIVTAVGCAAGYAVALDAASKRRSLPAPGGPESCFNCQSYFAEGAINLRGRIVSVGVCAANLPDFSDDGAGAWPPVQGDRWCEQWTPRTRVRSGIHGETPTVAGPLVFSRDESEPAPPRAE